MKLARIKKILFFGLPILLSFPNKTLSKELTNPKKQSRRQAPPNSNQKTSQSDKKKSEGKGRKEAPTPPDDSKPPAVYKVLREYFYIRWKNNKFKPGDRIFILKNNKKIGPYEVVGRSNQFIIARRKKSQPEPKVGDLVTGTGTLFRDVRETAPPKGGSPTTQLVLKKTFSLPKKVVFRESPPEKTPKSEGKIEKKVSPWEKTDLSYRINTRYRGIFARNGSYQTGYLESRMEVSNIAGSGFWHRHNFRVRYDFDFRQDPVWRDKYRPNLLFYQLAVGYRSKRWEIALGRLNSAPPEAGLLDGLTVEFSPKEFISFQIFGGFAPISFDLTPSFDRFRYGIAAYLRHLSVHQNSSVYFVGTVDKGRIDRQFLALESSWQLFRRLSLSAKGIIELFVPENPLNRTGPELSFLSAGASVEILKWLETSLSYNYYLPPIELDWLDRTAQVMPELGVSAFFKNRERHYIRSDTVFLFREIFLQLVLSGSLNIDENLGGSLYGKFYWYRIFNLPLSLSGSYTMMFREQFTSGQRYYFSFRANWPPPLSYGISYRLDLYLFGRFFGHPNHTISLNFDWAIPWGFYLSANANFRFGETDNSVSVFTTLGWRGRKLPSIH